MGATAAPSAVTVGRIAAVLGRSGKMIEQLNGEIASPVVQMPVMLTDDSEAIMMEGGSRMTGLMTQGGIAKMGSNCVKDTTWPDIELFPGSKREIDILMARLELLIKPTQLIPDSLSHQIAGTGDGTWMPRIFLPITNPIPRPYPE